MRNEIEIWVDEEKAEMIGQSLIQQPKGLFKCENRFLNGADVLGIFRLEDLEDMRLRQKGWWQCRKGYWHAKNEDCNGHREIINHIDQRSEEPVDHEKVRAAIDDCRKQLVHKNVI